MSTEPRGELAIRTIAMPRDTNPNGDIFGGWIVSQMDLAGLRMAQSRSKSRVTTVAIEGLAFLNPVHVGDSVCCYAELVEVGKTSMKIQIETWALIPIVEERRQVTSAVFSFVAINEEGKPQRIDR